MRVSAARVDDASVSVEGSSITQPVVSAIDLSRLPRLEGHRIDGILGYDFISRYVVAIDYARHELRIYDQPAFHYDGPGASVPVTLINRFPHIDADVKLADGETIRGRMVIDVGSNGSLSLTKAFVDKNRLRQTCGPDSAANGRRRRRRLDDVRHGTRRVALDRRHRAGAPVGEPLRRLGRSVVGVELVGRKHRRRDPAAIHRVPGLSRQAHDLRAERDDARRVRGRHERPVAPARRLTDDDVRRNGRGGIAGRGGWHHAAGDEIVSADGVAGSQKLLGELRERLRKPGERVVFVVRRGGEEKRIEIVTRRMV